MERIIIRFKDTSLSPELIECCDVKIQDGFLFVFLIGRKIKAYNLSEIFSFSSEIIKEEEKDAQN